MWFSIFNNNVCLNNTFYLNFREPKVSNLAVSRSRSKSQEKERPRPTNTDSRKFYMEKKIDRKLNGKIYLFFFFTK